MIFDEFLEQTNQKNPTKCNAKDKNFYMKTERTKAKHIKCRDMLKSCHDYVIELYFVVVVVSNVCVQYQNILMGHRT